MLNSATILSVCMGSQGSWGTPGSWWPVNGWLSYMVCEHATFKFAMGMNQVLNCRETLTCTLFERCSTNELSRDVNEHFTRMLFPLFQLVELQMIIMASCVSHLERVSWCPSRATGRPHTSQTYARFT